MGHDKNINASRPTSNKLIFLLKPKFFTNWLGQNMIRIIYIRVYITGWLIFPDDFWCRLLSLDINRTLGLAFSGTSADRFL